MFIILNYLQILSDADIHDLIDANSIVPEPFTSWHNAPNLGELSFHDLKRMYKGLYTSGTRVPTVDQIEVKRWKRA